MSSRRLAERGALRRGTLQTGRRALPPPAQHAAHPVRQPRRLRPARCHVQPADPNPPLLDRWILERLHAVVAECRKAYEAYEFRKVFNALNQFCTTDLSADLHRCHQGPDVLRRAGFPAPPRLADARCMRSSPRIARLLAPILAFTADEAWEHAPLHHRQRPRTGLPGARSRLRPRRGDATGRAAVRNQIRHPDRHRSLHPGQGVHPQQRGGCRSNRSRRRTPPCCRCSTTATSPPSSSSSPASRPAKDRSRRHRPQDRHCRSARAAANTNHSSKAGCAPAASTSADATTPAPPSAPDIPGPPRNDTAVSRSVRGAPGILPADRPAIARCQALYNNLPDPFGRGSPRVSGHKDSPHRALAFRPKGGRFRLLPKTS